MKNFLIAVAILAGIIIVVNLTRSGDLESTLSGVARTTPSPAPRASTQRMVNVTITSDPEGARVTVGGTSHAGTPVTVQVPADMPVPYTVRAVEPYQDYSLYEPYNGQLHASEDTAVNVWLERTTAEQQAEQRQAAEVIRQQREREERAQRVYYKVESNCRYGANLTFSNHNGDTAQYNNQGNAFDYWIVPRRGQFLYLSAQNQCDSGYVTVSFVKDDVVLQTNTSRGGYVIATVSRAW